MQARTQFTATQLDNIISYIKSDNFSLHDFRATYPASIFNEEDQKRIGCALFNTAKKYSISANQYLLAKAVVEVRVESSTSWYNFFTRRSANNLTDKMSTVAVNQVKVCKEVLDLAIEFDNNDARLYKLQHYAANTLRR